MQQELTVIKARQLELMNNILRILGLEVLKNKDVKTKTLEKKGIKLKGKCNIKLLSEVGGLGEIIQVKVFNQEEAEKLNNSCLDIRGWEERNNGLLCYIA